MTPLALLAVAAGGALGAVLRHLVSVSLAGRGRIPWGVLVVNVVGSFIAGLALGTPLGGAYSSTVQVVIVSGVCGGLTTFSTFAVDTVQLVLAGKHRAALASVGLTFALGIPAALLGLLLGLGLGLALATRLS